MTEDLRLNIKSSLDASGIRTGAQESADAVEAAAAKISAANAGIASSADRAASAAGELAKRFLQSGMSAKDVEGALVGLGYSATRAAETMALLGAAQANTAAAGAAVAASVNGLERSMAMASARMAGSFVPGLGMAGYQLGKVVAILPGMGPLLQAALPVAIIAFAVEQIKAYSDALEKTRDELSEFAIKTRDAADALDVENLKLGDQIDKLENHPTTNGPAIALEEIRIKADKVAESIAADIAKLEALLKAGTGIFTEIFSGSANEEAVGDALAPVQRAYQLAALARDAEGEKNALLQAQQIIEAALTDEKRKQAQFDAIQKIAVGEGALGTGVTGADKKAVQDYQEALAGINSMLKEEGSLATNAALTTTAANLEQKKSVEDYWKTYTGGFRAVNEELARHDAMWKKLFSDQAAEAKKAADESAKVMEEGQAHTAEQMARIGDQETERNIQNAKGVAAAIESEMRKIRATNEAGAAGQVGPFAKIIDTEQVRAQMREITTEMSKISAEIDLLKSHIASINDQPLVTAADQKNLQSYESEIKSLQQLLDGLNIQYQKISQQVRTTAQQMQTAMEAAATAGFNSFNQAFSKMMVGGMSFTRVLEAAWAGMMHAIIESILKMAEQWVVQHIIMEAIDKSFHAIGLATNTATNAAKIAANSALVISEAGLAGAGGVASMAAAPFPIDLMAPAFGAEMLAAALAFGSAESGAVLPQDMLLLAHRNEMVLPTALSQRVQDMTSGGGSTAITFAPHVSAMDGRSVSSFFSKNRKSMMRQIRTAIRNGGFR